MENGLPDSLLHMDLLYHVSRVIRWRHHEPEWHSGSLIAHHDVLHPGEVPPHNKTKFRVVTPS